MAIKKMRAKTRKGAVKRIKITNGGDAAKGKLIVNRINNARLHLKKRRAVKLRARRDTTLNEIHNKLKKIISV